jgi:oligopeptide transport system permease protein
MKVKPSRLRDNISRPLEMSIQAEIDNIDSKLFRESAFNEDEAERIGYSNYSYWRSTFRAFSRKKIPVALLFVLVILLVFTFIQPFLPGQYAATKINNHPITGLQLSNVKPMLTTVKAAAPSGTVLSVTRSKNVPEGWLAVSNIIGSVPRRTAFTVTEYLDDWVRIEYGGAVGYVINDFSTKLKLADDPSAVPYEATSNFNVNFFIEPMDFTNNGIELFVKASDASVADDGASCVLNSQTNLYLIPSDSPFLFGTNNIGQDLWALVWSGTRTSLFIGFMVAVIEAVIGMIIGMLWGYVRRLDRILTEIYNVLDNIPTTIVLILIAYILKPGIGTLIFAMSLTSWVGMARFIRNQIIIIRDRDYNLASRCLGTSLPRQILRNLLPYLVSVIMLQMALAIPGAIGSEVFITYIGLGLPVSVPSLGNLINAGRKLLSTSQSYQLVFPTVVLSIVTISCYMIGNAFADAADPKNHR